MSYFSNDHLKISDIIIDFEENISLISNANKLLLTINNLDEFNIKVFILDKSNSLH